MWESWFLSHYAVWPVLNTYLNFYQTMPYAYLNFYQTMPYDLFCIFQTMPYDLFCIRISCMRRFGVFLFVRKCHKEKLKFCKGHFLHCLNIYILPPLKTVVCPILIDRDWVVLSTVLVGESNSFQKFSLQYKIEMNHQM